jgi:hypothetical protein
MISRKLAVVTLVLVVASVSRLDAALITLTVATDQAIYSVNGSTAKLPPRPAVWTFCSWPQ